MPAASTRVVYAALIGNVAVAAAKLVGFAVSGSTAMLAESVHSVADSADQVFLLIGERRAARHSDGTHPLGYGMEIYFWTFIVALVVFILGGVASIYEGFTRLGGSQHHPSPTLNLCVLGAAGIFELSSFLVGYREFRRVVRGRAIPLWRFIVGSKDPSLFETLLEDSAALVGIAIAAAGVIGSAIFDVTWADGAASIAIGVLLVGASLVLANETRSLIAGEAVAPPVMATMRQALADAGHAEVVEKMDTLHLGPRVILVALTLRFAEDEPVRALRTRIEAVTNTLQRADERVAHVYVRPSR